ncbi:hypothetical protein EXN66_Car011540 [Channa argus]|uniref:Uncharacterized protein n=1 Tax=Channa argus TaxID=215402 RepID=A0A6G1Q0E3_CHAAH|nr:hypothetical protein EXN66_Car011540 [Channa argus]
MQRHFVLHTHIYRSSPCLYVCLSLSLSVNCIPRGLSALMNPLLPCEISGLPEKSPSLIEHESLLLPMSAQG